MVPTSKPSSAAAQSGRPRANGFATPAGDGGIDGVVVYASTSRILPAAADPRIAPSAGFPASPGVTQPSDALKRIQAARPGDVPGSRASAALPGRDLRASRQAYLRLVMQERAQRPITTDSYSLVKKFAGQKGASVGGATGSVRVRADDQYYQLKLHIAHASFKQQAAAQWSNVQNYGEVIGASVARALVGQGYRPGMAHPQLAPAVTLMHDSERYETAVVSLYLRDGQGDVDTHYVRLHGSLPAGRKHARLDLGDGTARVPAGTLRLKGEAARDVMRHVAAGALLGDHDINVGNLIIVGPPGAPANGLPGRDGGQLRVGRIDFGHAFNHLIHGVGGKMVGGGGVQDASGNRILDFFNRERVRGNPLNSSSGVSKLWRDYTGMLPSHEFAAALAEMANTDAAVAAQGIHVAERQFTALLADLLIDPSAAAPKEINDIVSCLKIIASNIGRPVASDDPITVLYQVMRGIQSFVAEGCAQMAQVAQLCSLQASIDDVLRTNPDVDPGSLEFPWASIEAPFLALAESLGHADPATARITWLKTSQARPALTGTLDDYLTQRRSELLRAGR